MAEVGRITENGEFLISGEMSNRLPSVTDGLVAHFPFDGTHKGIDTNPIMDYSIWEDGQVGSVGSFGTYSTGNSRTIGVDPWGKPTVVWKSVNDNAGIYYSPFPIDNTKLYRMSWWEKRVTNTDATYGRYYAGLNGYGSTNGVVNLSGGYNTNPYFWSTAHTGLTEGQWFLVVGHVFPHTYSGTSKHPDSGRYTVEGYLGETSADYKWAPETTTARSRTLTIYQANSTIEHHTCYPRIDICDGSEPTIEDLLRGEGNVINPIGRKIRYIRDWINGSTSNTGNHWVEIQAIDFHGNNIALGKSATSSILTDGNTNYSPYYSTGISGSGGNYVNVDLGDLYYIKEIKVWHYWADGRTYYDTKTEVSADNTNFNAIFDSSYDGEYSETSGGKTHRVTFENSTGTGLTNDGIFIGESSINLAPYSYYNNRTYGQQYTMSGWGGDTGYAKYYSCGGYLNMPYKKIVKKASGTGGIYIDDNIGINIQDNKTYIISCWVRASKSISVNGHALNINRVSDNTYRLSSGFNFTEKWERYSWVYNSGVGHAGIYQTRHIIYNDDNTDISISWCGFQVEEKTFETVFTETGRDLSKLVYRSNNFWNGSFSLFCDCKINSTSDWRMIGGAWTSWYFAWVSGSSNNIRVSWVDGTQKVLDTGAISGLDCREWNNIGFTYNSSTKNMSIYVNGTMEASTTNVNIIGNPYYTSIGDISNTSDSYKLNGFVKNYSVYNKELTSEEVNKLYNSKLDLKSNGNLTVNNIVERPIENSNKIFFDFGGHTRDINNVIEPITEESIAYGKQGVWVGHGYSNYADEGEITPYTGYSTFSHINRRITRKTVNTNGYLVMRASQLYPEQGKTIAISGYMKINGLPTDYKASSGSKFSTYSGYDTIYMYSDKTTGYFEGIVNVTASSGWLFHSPTYATNIDDVLTIDDLQINESSFNVPYVKNSIGTTKLYYPYNIIDCKTDFTIYGWWYPKVYADGLYRPCVTRNRLTSNYTQRRILIMGNGTTSRQLRCWHGSGGSGETSVYAPSSIDVQDNEWNFFCLKRSGDTMYLYLGNSTGFGYGTNESGANLNAEEDINSWGWLIGRYSDDANTSDAYHRDYSFIQRALTHDEISSVFKSQVQLNSDIISVKYNVVEGGI